MVAYFTEFRVLLSIDTVPGDSIAFLPYSLFLNQTTPAHSIPPNPRI